MAITLYTFGSKFGLPDPSPYCMKAMVLLKMAGLPYELATADLGKAPKGKAPYLDDGGKIIADSTFIRLHLEEAHGADFDKGLSEAEKGIAWSVEKLCEDHLYWHVVESRWVDDENFKAGPIQFFDAVPAPMRPFVVWMVRRQVKRNLHGQGTTRHSQAEIQLLAARAIDSIAAILGDKPYLMGDAPCGADATVFSFISGILCEQFETPIRDSAARHANLVAYNERMMAEYFPDFSAG